VRDLGRTAPARPVKSAEAFRTIGEVAGELELPTHVLRFWETKFPQLKPVKRTGGRRYYRPEDILLLRRIRQSLYQDGYTIRGVQKLLATRRSGAALRGAESKIAGPFPAELKAETESELEPDAAPRTDTAPAMEPSLAETSRTGTPDPRDPGTRAELEEIRRELLEARALLDELLSRPNGE
jgi:DNA-binding transcriptional MerR regulator